MAKKSNGASNGSIVIQCPEKLAFFYSNEYHRFKVAYGGRSSGKSRSACGALPVKALERRRRILCCREFQKSIKESVKKVIENAIESMGLRDYFTFTQNSITAVNGSEFIFQGLHANVDQIKSLEGIDIAYVEEAHNVSEESWDLLTPTIRAEGSEIWAVFNPRYATDATYKKFITEPPDDIKIVKINYTDNPFCPDVMIKEAEELKRKNIQKYREVWLGECQTINDNALWKMSTMIDPYRLPACNVDLERLVIGVDPAVTNTEKSDETGIIAAGCARNRATGEMHYYVLDDKSVKASPNAWAKMAIELYKEYEADRIVVEVNNGGDLVESVMRGIDPNISLATVRATRGKILRAEPVAAQYERGLVHHCGVFPELEDEMCNYCGTVKQSSPDRLDALVWAITALSGETVADIGTSDIELSY